MRVEVGAKFASMPTRTAAHTRSVNSTPGMWDMFHLFRFLSRVKGLLTGVWGHMGHNRAAQAFAERDRTPGRLSTYRDLYGSDALPGPRLRVWVYGDLNTFRMALVPQSE